MDTSENANAYLQSELFTADVVGGLTPLLDVAPDMRVYQPA
ncbi:hypothetical protein [Xanthomonas vesicatoria]|nr:hypothetical protein [Xanthomonas vesicatoria]